MSDNKYSLLMLESNKQNKEDDSEYDVKLYKNKSKYKINNYEKFRPKTIFNDEENEKELKGAENQVKSLLSNFIRNFQSEKRNSEVAYNPMNSLKYTIETEQNSSKKKSIKRIRTITYKKNLHRNSNKINSNFIRNKNQDSNFAKRENKLKALYSHKNIKKVNFSISPRNKKKKIDSQKVGNNLKFLNNISKSNKLKNGTYFNVPTLNLDNLNNNIGNKINGFHSGKNLIKANNYSNSNKSPGLNINSLIKKTQTQSQNNNFINFKNDDLILYNNESKEKRNSKFSSIKNFVNNITNNIKQINKNKILHKDSSIKKPNINRIKTEDKNKFFASNKIQRIFSTKSKKSNLFRKHQITSDKTDKKFDVQNAETNFKGINSIKNKYSLKRAETSKDNLNKNIQDEDKIKFLNLISNFKSIKNKIKQSIILRPEDQEEPKRDQKKNFPKKKLLTSDKLINLKNMDIEQTPKSNHDAGNTNTIVYMGAQNEGKENKNENKNKEITTEKEIKPVVDTQQTKSESLQEEFSFHSIKRKNALHFEKYRILSHKGVIYDSLDDEELEDEEDINKLFIHPNSNFSFCFDLILFLITIITFFELPLYMAMNLNFCKSRRFSFNDTINLLNELMNILDFIFGFFRAFYNWEEQLVKKNDIIAKKYLFGWCLFDIISAIPVYSLTKIYEPICDEHTNALYYNVILNNMHYLFMCNRLLKFMKIFSKNQAWKFISNRLNDFWSLIFNICLIILALNYTACLYIFIARNSYPNWILKAGLEINEFKHIYICAIYILLMALTTVGYGDITCCSLIERIFQVFLLIIGIIAYSWIVSSFSNFIQKLNEKSVDFEKKKNILDEIKINNPNLPDELYDRILRYLKFRHFHEKNIKNIIFDCLPVGLKNSLIYEMYKPIIKNFIFFKNFQNTDFIVQVILSFKPILAYKNYILVNEGDLIEDVIFVKHGVLSVELPINMTNPQENIEKYLNITDKDKEKEKSKLEKTRSRLKNDTLLGSFIKDQPKKLSFGNSSTINSSFNYKTSFINNSALTKAKTVKIEKAYVRILCIRENEHFGDVLMFLEERSPLQVRVRSKKSELFFLKKIDALKISNSYPNIWRRINKKSVYNFKQIKKNIKKIVEIYCSVKKVGEKSSEENSGLNDQFGLKTEERWVHPQNYDFNNSALKSTYRLYYDKRIKSEEEYEIKTKKLFSQRYDIDNDYFNDTNLKKEINKLKKSHSIKIKKTRFEAIFFPQTQILSSRFSFSDSSSSTDILQQLKPKKMTNQNSKIRSKKKKLTKKLFNVVNKNYMDYKNISQNHDDYPITIIAEETDKECSLNPMLNNGNNSVYKNSINSKAKMLENESCKINNKKRRKDKKKKNTKNKEKQNLFRLNEIKIDNYETIKNRELLLNSSIEANNENDDYYQINEEIYPGEVIQINNEENLLDKKFDFNLDYNLETNYNLSTNIEQNHRNREVTKLLKYFDEESKFIHNNKNNIIRKESSFIKSSKNLSKNRNYSNKLLFNNDNDTSNESSKNGVSSINLNIKSNWDNNILSINNDISLTINSSYENYNIISGDKLIKSKFLQNKLKEYIINESLNLSSSYLRNTSIRKTTSLEQNMKLKEDKKKSILKNLSQRKRLASSIVYNTTNINYINSVSFMKKKTKRTIRQSSSLINRNNSIISNSDIDNASINIKAENKKNVDKNKNESKNFEKEFIQSSTKNNVRFNLNNKYARKKQSMPYLKSTNNNKQIDISHHKSFNIIDTSLTGRAFNDETTKEIPRRTRMKRRNSVLVPSGLKTKRKKEDNLLNLIDYNIQRTNQKLNDPDAFYNNYFNNILKEEMKEKSKKKQ